MIHTCRPDSFFFVLASNTHIPMSIVDVFDFECQSTLQWITCTQKLHQENLLRHLHDHNSEIQLHHGNERKRGKNGIQPTPSHSTSELAPKTCSKIVAICLRDADAKHNTLARMHRWNIPTQLDLNQLSTNTSVTLDFTAHAFLATGEVNKDNVLQPGKFAVIIKKGASKNCLHF